MAKIKLHTKGGDEWSISADRVLANDVRLPGELSYGRGSTLWVLGNEYGPMGAVWAPSMEEAFDTLVDADLADGILVDEHALEGYSEEEIEDLATLGNASEYADLSYAWAKEADWKPERDWRLLCMFAEARGAGADTLAEIR